jgi:heterodisulfide reductase subunit C
MAQLGLKERVLKSETLWLCASCFTCTDRCPQDIEVASIIRVLRNLAAKQGIFPTVIKEQTLSVLKSGYAYKIPELRKRKRLHLDLPPLPKSDPEKIQKILKKTGIKKLIEKWEIHFGE